MGDQKDGIGEAPRSTKVPPNFASVEASVLDEIVREKNNAHEEDGSAPEDRIMAVFNKIHELLMDNDRDVGKVMESQGKQIKGLLELAAENCKVIALLWEDYVARCKGEAMVADVDMKKQRSVGFSSTRSGEAEDPVKSSKCSAKGKKHARTSKVVSRKGTPRQPLNVVKEVLKSSEHVDVVASGFVELCDLPLLLDLSFYPPAGMNLSTLELVVVSYIFMPDLDKKYYESLAPRNVTLVAWSIGQIAPSSIVESARVALCRIEILVPIDHCVGDKKAFWTLRPGKEVIDDVLNLVATMLTDERTENTWWLSTTFSALFLHTMLRGRRFYKKTSVPAMIKDFKLTEHITGQQGEYSRDCGVWVAQWMELSQLWTSYDLEVVNDQTRMRLALDLILSKSNSKNDEICKQAVEHHDTLLHKKTGYKHGNGGKDPKMDVCCVDSSSSQSLTI
ncbi:hypothetical protein HN51_031327 [Arachis hypogaea]